MLKLIFLRGTSLRYKLAGVFGLLFVSISIFLFLYLPYRFHTQAIAIMQRSAEGATEAVCYSLSPAIFFEDSLAVADVLKTAMLNGNVVDIDVYDFKGKLVGEALREGWEDDDDDIYVADDSISVSHDFMRITGSIVRNERAIGKVSVRFHLDSVNKEVYESKQTIAVISLLILGTGILLLLVVGRLVTNRLLKFGRVSDAVAHGDLQQRVNEPIHDEIGKLARTFNNMLGSIEEANASLSARAAELNHELLERRRVEAEVLRIRDLLRDVIDSMPSPLVAVDRQGKIAMWNRKAAAHAGLDESAMNGACIWEVFPALRDNHELIARAFDSGGAAVSGRVTSEVSGEIRYFEVNVFSLHSSEDGAVVRLDDITEEVRMLELMAQTEKMMSVGGLAAGMAHEINNPLGIIVQSIQTIQRRIEPGLARNDEAAKEAGVTVAGVRTYFDKREIPALITDILAAGKRAATIVTNMLNFSRHSSSGLIPTSIPELLRNAANLAASDYDLKKKFDFRHIDLNFDISETLPLVPCIESKIEQVILNLMKNAAQAISEHGSNGPPKIICRAYEETKYVTIEIIDNGPGMPDEIRRRVFEPFFTTKEVGMGTGLGLSVSYFIIHENHGGVMTVDSAPGSGTKFTVKLPLIHEPHQAKSANSKATQA